MKAIQNMFVIIIGLLFTNLAIGSDLISAKEVAKIMKE
jgi:hypothetical protein